jgi:SAM-dependent methyltransferase
VVAPLVAGRRVLDLGSNNGSLPLMMARAGAAAVVGLEMTPQIADFARFNARVLAWRDQRPYDIRIENGDMRRMLTGEFGRFDVVTAFCSLYYLPEADMARIIRAAADMGATMILQSNDVIDNLPAHTRDLQRLLSDNGYADVEVHTYPGFARSLLVGRPAAAAR